MKSKFHAVLFSGLALNMYACCVTNDKQVDADLKSEPVATAEPVHAISANPLFPCVTEILFVTDDAVGDPCATTEGVISDVANFNQSRYERSFARLTNRGAASTLAH